jgi:cold shock CspA family protein
MAHGTVKSFDQAGGHGYIVSDEGETLWVHRGSITAAGLELVPGQSVVFDRQEGGMGVQAVGVAAAEPAAEGGRPEAIGLAERSNALAGLIASKERQGYRVESQSETEARLIARNRKAWFIVGARLPEKRELATVDEQGKTNIERLPARRY